MRRPPLTLWRYLSGDLWRLIALSALGLVAVISFAAAIKPLAEGSLTPIQALRFMLLASLPMLQFALPFAAAFAATLAYHRFASENEATAGLAAGVSYRAMLAPTLLAGVVLCAGLLALQHQVIPGFLRQMERLISRDAAQILVNSVQRGDSVRLDNGVIIHADSVDRLDADPASGATDRLLLKGVVAMAPHATSGVQWEATAQLARVWLFDGDLGAPSVSAVTGDPDDGPGRTTIVLELVQSTKRGEDGSTLRTERDVLRFTIPDSFRDDPKFYTYGGLQRLKDNPDLLSSVVKRRVVLAGAIAAQRAEEALLAQARQDKQLLLADAEGQWARVQVGALEPIGERRWRILTRGGGDGVELLWRLEDGSARLQTARSATIALHAAEPGLGVEPTLSLALESVSTRDSGAGAQATTRARVDLTSLRLAGTDFGAISEAPSDDLLAMVGDAPAGESAGEQAVADAARALRSRIRDARREVLSKQHERAALAAACLVMVVAGAVSALRLRDSRPLLVYTRSFFPAVIAVVLIAAGENLTEDIGPGGLTLLWSGVAGLGVWTLVEYARLAKH